MLKKSLARKLLITLLPLALIWLLWPAVALADDPDEVKYRCSTWDLTQDLGGWTLLQRDNNYPNPRLVDGSGLTSDFYFSSGQYRYATKISRTFSVTYTTIYSVTSWFSPVPAGGWYIQRRVVWSGGSMPPTNASPPGGTTSYTDNLGGDGGDYFSYDLMLPGPLQENRYFSAIRLCYLGPDLSIVPQSGERECSTVPDADFLDDDTWTLTGLASITNSISTLPPGDAVSQNVNLSSNRTYNAVIEATVTNPVDLVVSLGFGETSNNETLSISTSGWYTANLSTPANLAGPIAYTLFNNDASDSINIDFTCLYSDDATGECIYPTNGSFNTADDWEWYRGAQWETAAHHAKLPYNPGDPAAKALVTASDRYTMPTLAEGDYLLLSFDAQTEISQSAMVATLVRGNTATIEAYMEVYPGLYDYEIDISDVAGESYTYLAFANSGVSPAGGAELEGPVYLDNVCVFITDRPPNLPSPVDPNQLDPVELGFNYTSCSDVDGLLAYFGVNMAQYRAIYLYDPPGWDPSGWVPWLVAAFWNILATYLCIFMAAFVTLVRLVEYAINNFLNIGTWLVREWRLLVLFIDDLWAWITGTTINMGGWFSSEGGRLLGWYLASGGNLLVFLAFLVSFYFGNVLSLFDWLSTGLLPRGVSLGKNALVDVANWLLQGWNLFINNLGPLISSIIEAIFDLWAYLVPYLEAAFWAVTSTIAPVFMFANFIAVAWGLFWMLLKWIWAYGFMLVHVPINFYYAFNSGVSDDSFSYLLSCSGTDFWCGLLAGVQMVNTVAGHTILYPIVITGIILGTIAIFWKYIWETFTIEIR